MKLTLSFALLFLFAGYSISAQNVRFHVVFGENQLEFGKHEFVSLNGEVVRFTEFGFYLSDFEWTDSAGNKIKQSGRVELLQADEDSDSMLVQAPIKPAAVCFRFGLDSATQLAGRMDGAMDPARGMYWAWNTGYIQCRIEGFSPESGGKKGKFEFHLGGYALPYPTDHMVCLDLKKTNSNVNDVYIDLQPLFQSVSVRKTHSVLAPGKLAMKMANILATSFRANLSPK